MTDLPIPGEWIVQGGAVGLLALGVLLVFTGRLIPRSTYNDLKDDRDHWREVAMKAVGHTEQLLPAARVATQVSRALTDQVTQAFADIPGTPPAGHGNDREGAT